MINKFIFLIGTIYVFLFSLLPIIAQPKHAQYIFSSIISIIIIISLYFYFKLKCKEKIFDFVLYFNIIILVFLYLIQIKINTFDQNFFRIHFNFGSSSDFFTLMLSNNIESIKSGYFPSTISFFNILSDIFNWNNKFQPKRNDYILYNILFCLSYIILIFNLKNIIHKKYFFQLVFIIISSYIFLYSYERGNISFISMALLSCLLYSHIYNKKNQFIFYCVLFLSIKIINLFLVYVLIRNYSPKYLFFILFYFFILQALSLFYIYYYYEMNFYSLFEIINNLRQNTIYNYFPNSIVSTTTSSLLSFVNNLRYISDFKLNIDNTNTNINIVQSYFNIIFIILILSHFFIIKNNFINDSILVLLLISLFKISSSDYNLQLLLPFLIYKIFTSYDLNQIKYFLFIFLNISIFPLSSYNYNFLGGSIELYGTLKNICFPIIFVIILISINKNEIKFIKQ